MPWHLLFDVQPALYFCAAALPGALGLLLPARVVAGDRGAWVQVAAARAAAAGAGELLQSDKAAAAWERKDEEDAAAPCGSGANAEACAAQRSRVPPTGRRVPARCAAHCAAMPPGQHVAPRRGRLRAAGVLDVFDVRDGLEAWVRTVDPAFPAHLLSHARGCSQRRPPERWLMSQLCNGGGRQNHDVRLAPGAWRWGGGEYTGTDRSMQ